MVDELTGKAGTLYDGLGGALSVPKPFSQPRGARSVRGRQTRELAGRLLQSLARSDEPFLMGVLRRRSGKRCRSIVRSVILPRSSSGTARRRTRSSRSTSGTGSGVSWR
jgi:hypothetical protein